MSGIARPVLRHWPRFFLYSLFFVFLAPLDPLHYLPFLPGYFVSLSYCGMVRPLYLWLGWSFFSALLAPGFPGTLLDFGREAIVAGAGFVAGLYGRQDRRWLVILVTFAFLMVGLILIQAAAAPPFPPGWVGPAERTTLPFRVTGLWHNPNLTGLFLAYLLPLLLAAAESRGKAQQRLTARLFVVLVGLTVMALIFTYSRTAWGAALASLFFYWGIREKAKLRRTLLILLLLVGFFPSVGSRLGNNPLASGTVGHRFQIWQETWGLVQKYPLTGGGKSELRALLRPLRADHAHNLYLQLAAEKGIPALLLLGWLLHRFHTAARLAEAAGMNGRLQRGVQAAFGGQLVAALAEHTWAVPLGSFLFWFAFAMVTAERRPMGPKEALAVANREGKRER